MRRKVCLSASLVAFGYLAVAVPLKLEAQGGFGGRPTAGIFGGVSFPRGAFDDEVGLGWHAGALAKIRVYGPLDARIDGTYSKFAKKDLTAEDATVSTNATVGFGTLSALLNLGTDSSAYPGDNTVSPYLIAGLGKYRLDFDAVCTGAACDDFIDPGIHTFWGLNVGGGATVPLAGLRTFLEARYHRIARDELDGGSRVMVLVSAGIKFR